MRTLQTASLQEPLTVLVAHENATLLSLIVEAPALRGHRVRVAHDERTARDLLAAEEIHLLLLDPHLVEGSVLANLLRQQKNRRDRPPYIIVMSDLVSETDRQKALLIAADKYWPNLLNLPFLLGRIAAVIHCLSRRGQRSGAQERQEHTGG